MIVCPCIRTEGKNLQGSVDTGANDLQSFKSQVSPAKLLQYGLLYSEVHRSCQKLASSVVSPQGPSLLGPPPALMWGPPGRRHSCPTTILPTGYRGTSLVLEHFLPFLLLAFVSTGLIPTYSHYSLQLQFLLHSNFSPLPPSQMGSALASSRSDLELGVSGSVKCGGSFWQLLTKTTPVTPVSQNLAMHNKYRPNIDRIMFKCWDLMLMKHKHEHFVTWIYNILRLIHFHGNIHSLNLCLNRNICLCHDTQSRYATH